MPRHHVDDAVGCTMMSFVDGARGLCHENVSVALQATCARTKIEAQLLFRPQQFGTWHPRPTKNGQRIRKLVLGKPDVAFDKVIGELSKVYGVNGKHFVACRMQLNKPKRSAAWVNPELKEQLAEIKATRSLLENNGGQARSRFFQKSLRIQEAYLVLDWGEGPERLSRELENFSKDFQVFC